MKRKCLELWLEALKSGKYSQAYGGLRIEDGYDPFGILCELSELDKWTKEPNSKDMSYLNQTKYLPKEVACWAGISKDERNILTGFIIVFNDSRRITLHELADLLAKRFDYG